MLATCYQYGDDRLSDNVDYMTLRIVVDNHAGLIAEDSETWRDLNMIVGTPHRKKLEVFEAARYHLLCVMKTDPAHLAGTGRAHGPVREP